MHVYVDNVFYAAVVANQHRPDVGAYLDTPGLHGYSIPFTAPGGSHRIDVYAIGLDGSGTGNHDNPTLTNSGLLTPPPPPLPPAGTEGTLNGTAGGDSIIGTLGQDRIFGYGGNDTLIGNGNHSSDKGELLDGGDGNDVLIACSAGDRSFTAVQGGSGHDIAYVESWGEGYIGPVYDFTSDVEEVYACGGGAAGEPAIGYPINPQFDQAYPADSISPHPSAEGGIVVAWAQDAWGPAPAGYETGVVVRNEGMLIAGQPNTGQRFVNFLVCSLAVTCKGGGPVKLAPYTPKVKTPGGAPIETISPGTGGLRNPPGGPPGPRNGFPAYTVPNGGKAPYIGPAGGGCPPSQCVVPTPGLYLQIDTGFIFAQR